MSNNLAGLSAKLATALRDTDHAAWNSTEKDDLITFAVAGLYPSIARRLDPTASTIPLVAGTYFYDAPASVIEIENLELIDSDSAEHGYIQGQAWAEMGDTYGTLKVRISPTIVEGFAGGTVRVHGYGRYDTTTNLIPDDFVPLVLAMARSDAYERIIAERSRFLQWQASEQEQDSSVNELLNLLQSAQVERERQWRRFRTQRRPRPGRLG